MANLTHEEQREFTVLGDADRTRRAVVKVTYNTASDHLLAETAERLSEEHLIDIRKATEPNGHRSVTLMAIHNTGDNRLMDLHAKFAAID